MKKNRHLLAISLDANIVRQTSTDAQDRQLEYAKHFDSYTIIILNTKKNVLKTKQIKNVTILPTNSCCKITMISTAITLARRQHGRQPFDIITAQDPIAAGLIGVILKHLLRIPLNIQLHTDYFSRRWRTKSLLNQVFSISIPFVLKQADSIRTVNQTMISQLQSRVHSITSHIFNAPLMVDTQFFYKPVQKKKHIRHFISVGRLAKEKNFPLLIKAFSRVTSSYPHIHLTIVGGGGEYQSLQQMITKLHTTSRITLTGTLSRKEVRNKLHTADAFVLTSNYEGWGLVFIEAFAAGLPIITTKVSSTGQLVIDQHNGIVVPVGDQLGIETAFVTMITNPSLGYQMAKSGQKRIIDNYSPEIVIKEWVNGLQTTGLTPSAPAL